MTNRSNTAGSLISLPKGGGAVAGLGETFAPDAHTGTGNLTIPLGLPAGRHGLQPALALAYSSGSGQGLFGLGWKLGIPGVTRKTAKGVPRYRDADVFVLSGSEDLVPVDAVSEIRTRYRPRTEGAFARIERHRDPARREDYWEVRGTNGLVSYYGTPGGGGGGGGGGGAVDPAVLHRPGAPADIFSWGLTLTVDPFGNRIEYAYDRHRGTAADERRGHRWDVPVLASIRYADHGDRAAPRFLVAVTFEYEDRPDPFSDHRAGFEIRCAQRCRAILVTTHAGVERRCKAYRLRYQTDPRTAASLLAGVDVVGFDAAGAAVPSSPPIELAYTAFEPERRDRRRLIAVGGRELPAASLAEPSLALVDLHGQGLPDLVELGAVARYWRNLGDGMFDVARPLAEIPSGVSLASPGVQLFDADGDGRIDVVITRETTCGYVPLRAGTAAAAGGRAFRRWDTAPSFDLRDPEVRLLDLTGDGVIDALRTSTRLECYFNDPERGWHATRAIERGPLADFPDVQLSDPRVLTADMTGDGLTDLVLVHDGSVCYWPSRGYGDFGPRIQMRDAPRLPHGYLPARLLLGDVNGDGVADLVYVDDGRVILWINQSGNAWSAPIVIEGTPRVTAADALRLVDLLGTGVAGVLWTGDRVDRDQPHYYFLDLTGGAKPYLLARVRNNRGAETSVEYQPSTRAYLDDCGPGGTRWLTTLPFPVQTVARVEVIDACSGGRLVTRYRYHHGYWDGHERELRGFGCVEQLDTEATFDPAIDSPPVLTKTWFHQGAVDDGRGGWCELDYRGEQWAGPGRDELALTGLVGGEPPGSRDAARSLRGSVLRTELYALDGGPRQRRPYTVTEAWFGARDEGRRIYFPHRRAGRTTQWERGDDPMTQVSYTHGYDALGRALAQTQIACPRGWRGAGDRPATGYLATRSATTYAVPAVSASPALHAHDRPARTDGFELIDTAGRTLAELLAIPDDAPALRRVQQTLTYYDGAAFIGRPLGELGAYGAVSRRETLVLTPAIVAAAYGAAAPAYLASDAPVWPPEYPAAFRAALPVYAGYTYRDGSEPGTCAGWYAIEQRLERDVQASADGRGRGLVRRQRDPLGHDTAIAYDELELLPVAVTDAAGLVTRAEYDLRFLQPRATVDPNGNRREVDYLPSGLPAATWVRGKAADADGDGDDGDRDRDQPSARYVYDLFAFAERAAPPSITTIRRVYHDTDATAPAADRDATIETREYSDGFGRALQTRTQGEDLRFGDARFGGGVLPADQMEPATGAVIGRPAAPGAVNVVVSGARVYDNKGRVIATYEPYYATGWGYAPPSPEDRGRCLRMTYDPRGHVVRTLHPDGSEALVVQGIPAALDAPQTYAPTPWEAYTYDPNDNAGRTHPQDAGGYRHAWDTPSSIAIDALGRTVRSVQRNRTAGDAGGLGHLEEVVTTFTVDITGNVVAIGDPLGRAAFVQVYDLAKRALRTTSLDAGVRWSVVDAAGLVIETRDAKRAVRLHQHDGLGRPCRQWACDAADGAMTLRVRTTYGDELPPAADAARANLLGRPHVVLDGAGKLTITAYDAHGNLREKTREVIADAEIAAQVNQGAAMANGCTIDWDHPPRVDGAYTTTVRYDALDRVVETTLPADVTGGRKKLSATFDRAGALEAIRLDGAVFVERIAYDARGQRVLVAYGNGYLTRHAYDPATLRVRRTRTERYAAAPAGIGYLPRGGVVQDLGYDHDLAGNLLAIHDRTPGCGVHDTALGRDALDRVFAYDALSRLVSATGRETEAAWPPAAPAAGRAPWDRSPYAKGTSFGPAGGGKGNPTTLDRAPDQTRAYVETYRHDAAGNLIELRHQTASSAWVRRFAIDGGTNRLARVGDDGVPARATHAHDASGNVIREDLARHFAWDAADRLAAFSVRAKPGTAASLESCYLYDAGGERIKKWSRTQGGAVESTVYVDGVYEHAFTDDVENVTVHVADGQRRIAMVRIGDAFPDDGAPELAVKYHVADHLGSSQIVLGAAAAGPATVVNREELYPYGETSYGGFARKRYRFTGLERDEDSGLQYHHARYYAPWLARWMSCDPIGAAGGLNQYTYAGSSPVNAVDRTGEQPSDEAAAKFSPAQIKRWGEISAYIKSRPPGSLLIPPASSSEPRMRADHRTVQQRGADTAFTSEILEFQRRQGPVDPEFYKLYRASAHHAATDSIRWASSFYAPGRGARPGAPEMLVVIAYSRSAASPPPPPLGSPPPPARTPGEVHQRLNTIVTEEAGMLREMYPELLGPPARETKLDLRSYNSTWFGNLLGERVRYRVEYDISQGTLPPTLKGTRHGQAGVDFWMPAGNGENVGFDVTTSAPREVGAHNKYVGQPAPDKSGNINQVMISPYDR